MSTAVVSTALATAPYPAVPDLPLIKRRRWLPAPASGTQQARHPQVSHAALAAVAFGWIFHPPPELFTMSIHKWWAE
jgi:hypothetical protein